MYNKGRKRNFILQYTKSANTAIRLEDLFSRIEHIELAFGKDVCEMSEEEYKSVMSFISGVTHATGERMLVFMQDYIKWCVSANIDKANESLLAIKYDQTDNIRNGMFKSPEHLHQTLEKIFHPVDLQTMHNIYRCYIWLSYIGLRPQEIETIEKTSCDFSSNTVVSETGAHFIYMEAIPTLLSCVQQTDFRCVQSFRGKQREYVRERANSRLLLSRYSSSVDCQEILHSVNNILATHRPKVSFRFDRLHLSGVFYRMYRMEIDDGLPVNFRSFAEDEVRTKRMYTRGNTEEYSIVAKTAHMLKNDYANWKLAFNL